MELNVYINGVEYSQSVVQGITFSEEYNETLDSGTLIINGVKQITDLLPYDDVFIYEGSYKGYGKNVQYSGFYKHLLVDDYSEELINIDKKLYRYTIQLFSETKKLETIQLPNTSITQPIQINLKKSVWTYLNQFLELYNPLVKTSKSFYTNKVGTLVFKDTISFTSKNELVGADAYYNRFNIGNMIFSDGAGTEYTNIIYDIANDTLYYKGSNVIEVYNKTQGWLNPQYKTLSILSTFTQTAYEDKILQLFMDENKASFEAGYPFNDTWEYKRKYELDASLKNTFSEVYSPDFTLNNPSLKDILTQLMLVKDKIPYVKDDVIYALDITQRKETFNFDTNAITNVIGSMSSSNYANNLKRGYSNALSRDTTCRRVEYLGFRNSDDALLTIDNMRLETQFPIYKINKVYMCYYKKGKVVKTSSSQPTGKTKTFLCKQDITPLVLLNTTRNLLSLDWNDFADLSPDSIEDLAKYKLCTVGYDIGSKYITGWGTKYNYVKGFWDKEATYVENILKLTDSIKPYGIYSYTYLIKQGNLGVDERVVFDADLKNNIVSPASNFALAMKTLTFQIEYEAFYNGAIIHSKDNSKRDDITINDNSSSSLTILEKDGLFQKEKLNRFGNKAIQINATYTDIRDLQELGSVYDDDIIVYHREYSINNNCIIAKYYGTKDYVLKNYFTSVYAKHRTYNLMSYGESVNRQENKKSYLFLSKNKLYKDTRYGILSMLNKVNIVSGINSFKWLLSAFVPSKKYSSIGFIDTPYKINAGYITGVSDSGEFTEELDNSALANMSIICYDSYIGTKISYSEIGKFMTTSGFSLQQLWKDYISNFKPIDINTYKPFENQTFHAVDNYNNIGEEKSSNAVVYKNGIDLRQAYNLSNDAIMEGDIFLMFFNTQEISTTGIAINVIGETIINLTIRYSDGTSNEYTGFDTLNKIQLPANKYLSKIIVKMSAPLEAGYYRLYFSESATEPIGFFYIEFNTNKSSILKYRTKFNLTSQTESPRVKATGNGTTIFDKPYSDNLVIKPTDNLQTIQLEYVDGNWDGYINFYSYIPQQTTEKYLCDVNGFISGYSLCFNVNMYDNVSSGVYVKSLEPQKTWQTPTKDFTGSVQDWYLITNKQTGQIDTLSLQAIHKDNNDLLDGKVIEDGDNEIIGTGGVYDKLLNLPNFKQKYSEEFSLGGNYFVYKDNKEKLDITLQIEPVADNEDILFSQWLMKLSDTLSSYNKVDSDYALTEYINNDMELNFLSMSAVGKTNSGKYRGWANIILEIKISDFDILNSIVIQGKKEISPINLYFEGGGFEYGANQQLDNIAWTITSIDKVSNQIIEVSAIQEATYSQKNKPSYKSNDEVKLTLHKIEDFGASSVPSDKYWFSLGEFIGTEPDRNFAYFPEMKYEISYYDKKIELDYNNMWFGCYDATNIPELLPPIRSTNPIIFNQNGSSKNTLLSKSYVVDIVSGSNVFLKNMYVVESEEKLKNTLVYNEYHFGDTNFEKHIRKDLQLANVFDFAELTTPDKYKPILSVNLQGINNTTKSVQYWYLDRESGSYKFVFGVNITQEDFTKGEVPIYLSYLNYKDTRVYDIYNRVIGNVSNYVYSDKYGDNDLYIDHK